MLTNFFNKSPVPDIGAVWAHYSQWLAQPAGLPATFTVDDFATTADVKPATRPVNGRLLFTVGCHSGLNVPDTLPAYAGGDADVQRRFKDWAQAYGAGAASVYVANTGFGYGDTDVADLSERLYDHFASNLNSGGTVGEQWIRALHQYYAEPSNYDVIDEKVMIEANMYGLPFYGFGGTPQHVPTAPTPPTHAVVGGVDTAHLPALGGFNFARDAGQRRLVALHRPAAPGRLDASAPGRWARCRSSTGRRSPPPRATSPCPARSRTASGSTASRPTRSTT